MQKAITKISETKNYFFEKINVIDKPLSRFIKKKRERTQINKIRNNKAEVTTDNTKIQRILRDYKATICKKKKKKKKGQPGRNGQVLRKVHLLRLNQEEIENINRPIISN